MKVVWLHPPLYPVNVDLFDQLGALCELVVFVFGDAPSVHSDWRLSSLYQAGKHRFRIQRMGRGYYPRGQIFLPLFVPALLREKPEVVLTIAFAPYGFYAAWLKRFCRYRLMMFTDATAHSDSWAGNIRLLSRRYLLGLCDLAIGCSPQTVAYLQQIYPRVNVALCWHTVHVTQWRAWQQALPPARALRRKWRLPLFAKLLLGVGRLAAGKNWQLGFPVLQRYPQLHYLLIGDGPEHDRLLEQAQQQGVGERFHLRRKCSPLMLAEAYTLSDALFFPSSRETFGFVVSEAMACGLPIFCSQHCGVASWVEQSNAGLVFNPETDFLADFARFWQKRKSHAHAATQAMDQLTLEWRAQELLRLIQHSPAPATANISGK